MSQNPPFMKLEPADGRITPSQPTDPNDFLSPDNPAMILPLILLSVLWRRSGGVSARQRGMARRGSGVRHLRLRAAVDVEPARERFV